jgi:hypothetical protein
LHDSYLFVCSRRHRIIQRWLETRKPPMTSSLAVYAWSKLMLEMYFVACPACIRSVSLLSAVTF